MEIHGDLYIDEDLRVDGILHGSVESYGNLEISNSGLIEGKQVKAKKVIVRGILKADTIHAEDLVFIARTGKVEGKIIAGSISIEQGAMLNASVQSQELSAPELASTAKQLEGALGLDANLVSPTIRPWHRDDYFIPE
jgi:cytoskeletal protein CcmA (bactofilin family)